MEFLRFGSSIPGSYWGCCACDIIQNFKVDPDAKASIQLVEGDGGSVLMKTKDGKREAIFAGPTWRDIFWQRLRYGTFSNTDMPNHAFLAIITSDQVAGTYGAKWLAILKEAGFEFIRTINNSVYLGPSLLDEDDGCDDYDEYECDDECPMPVHGGSANYLFGLFRNIGRGAAKNPFQPPKEWTDLGSGCPTIWSEEATGKKDEEEVARKQQEFHRKVWDNLPKGKFFTETELEKDDVPIWLAGQRSANPQRKKPKVPNPGPTAVKVASEGLPAPFKSF